MNSCLFLIMFQISKCQVALEVLFHHIVFLFEMPVIMIPDKQKMVIPWREKSRGLHEQLQEINVQKQGLFTIISWTDNRSHE